MPSPRASQNPPAVSLAVPVHNGAQYLEGALAALVAQEYEPLEIVVLDNASTDGTKEIARCFESRDERVRYLRFEGNAGASANFNRGFHLTSGDLFGWAAHDDRMLPEYVTRCVAALAEAPQAPLCVPHARLIDVDGQTLGLVHQDEGLSAFDLATRVRTYLHRTLWVMVYGLYRREHLARTRLFEQAFGPDVLLVWQLLLRAPLAIVDYPLLEYRLAPVGAKRATAVATGLKPDAPPGWHRFGHVKMARNLRAMAEGELSANDAAVVRTELRRWLVSGDFRTLLARDLFAEANFYAARRNYPIAAAASLAMVAVRPTVVMSEAARRMRQRVVRVEGRP